MVPLVMLLASCGTDGIKKSKCHIVSHFDCLDTMQSYNV